MSNCITCFEKIFIRKSQTEDNCSCTYCQQCFNTFIQSKINDFQSNSQNDSIICQYCFKGISLLQLPLTLYRKYISVQMDHVISKNQKIVFEDYMEKRTNLKIYFPVGIEFTKLWKNNREKLSQYFGYDGIINFENASDITYALLVQSKNAIL